MTETSVAGDTFIGVVVVGGGGSLFLVIGMQTVELQSQQEEPTCNIYKVQYPEMEVLFFPLSKYCMS